MEKVGYIGRVSRDYQTHLSIYIFEDLKLSVSSS